MASPMCTIITPAYNAAGTIDVAIGSVRKQTETGWELIVVDDGSQDGTPERVEAVAALDERVKLIRQENAGASAARNAALDRAQGEYLSLLDADDAWLPNHLTSSIAALAGTPGAGISYSDGLTFSDSLGRIHRRTILEDLPPVPAVLEPDALLTALLRVNFITASSATITRAAWERVGGFDSELRGTEDLELWLRVARAGFSGVRAGTSPQILLRDSPNSQSTNHRVMFEGHLVAISRATAGTVPAAARIQAAETERWLHGQIDRLDRHSGVRGRLVGGARRVRQRLTRRRDWRPMPPDIAETLQPAGGPSR